MHQTLAWTFHGVAWGPLDFHKAVISPGQWEPEDSPFNGKQPQKQGWE